MMLAALSDQGATDKMWGIYAEMRSAIPTATADTSVPVGGSSSSSGPSVGRGRGRGRTPAPPPDNVTFNTMLKAATAEGSSKARQVFLRLMEDGFKPDVHSFSTLMAACGRDDNVEVCRSALLARTRWGRCGVF